MIPITIVLGLFCPKKNTIVADNMPLSAGINCVMIHEGFMGFLCSYL